MNDQPQDEPDEEAKEEHVEAHTTFFEELSALVETAYKKEVLGPWCLMSELVALAVDIELDNEPDREAFLKACGDVFDMRRKERLESATSINQEHHASDTRAQGR